MEAKRKTEPLSMTRVMENVEKLPKRLQAVAIKMLNAELPLRHGSPTYERRYQRDGLPHLAINDEARKEMARMIAHGASYRSVEVVWKLESVNGNDVHRCVKIALKDKEFAKEIKPIAKAHGIDLPFPKKRKLANAS